MCQEAAELGLHLQASCVTLQCCSLQTMLPFSLSVPFPTSLLRNRLYQWSFSFLAEPHEICDEESLASVVWKETPAGDAAAVRCPRNATGKDDSCLDQEAGPPSGCTSSVAS